MPADDFGHDELLSELGRMHSELAAQQRLSAMTAHDLSGPAQVIVGLTEIALENPDLLPEVRSQLEHVHRSAQTMAALISDLARGFGLDDPAHFRLERLNLADLVQSVCHRGRLLADAHHVVVVTGTAPEVRAGAWVDADAVKVERALVNVLANAIKFSPLGSTVTVEVALDEKAARVHVTDQGPGVSAESRARIFEPFHREQHTSHLPGSGLGLFISRQILESHGGSISVQPRPGPGTTFVLELPLAPPGPSSTISGGTVEQSW